jgi:hypothetical protein
MRVHSKVSCRGGKRPHLDSPIKTSRCEGI